MKTYKELVQEVLDQRAIIDNRNIKDVNEASESVLIAFNQACEFLRDIFTWRWLKRTETYLNEAGSDSYPIPYGHIIKIVYKRKRPIETECELEYVKDEFNNSSKCPSQWRFNWEKELVEINPKVSADCDELSETAITYTDLNIATLEPRTDKTMQLLKRFDLNLDTSKQYLNVPEYCYDAYARCVILKTRLLLNEGAQATVFNAQDKEFNDAYENLLIYNKTPLYSQRIKI